ncbi:hypothetical protein B5X24_HaOG214361 [Helicoverpa armigera]|nr:hypothetical protein B5X24_HaOG214361 [Helicoverpa armigera]
MSVKKSYFISKAIHIKVSRILMYKRTFISPYIRSIVVQPTVVPPECNGRRKDDGYPRSRAVPKCSELRFDTKSSYLSLFVSLHFNV